MGNGIQVFDTVTRSAVGFVRVDGVEQINNVYTLPNYFLPRLLS